MTIRSLFPNAVTAIFLLLAGCTVGPNFTPPAPDAPPAWHDRATTAIDRTTGTLQFVTSDPGPDWWTRFNDPELTALLARATAGNFDLKIAVQRIVEARAGETSAAADGLPSVSAKGNYTRQQASLDQLKGQIGTSLPIQITSAPAPFGLYEGAIDASWELDLFGKVRRSVEASRANTAALIANRDDALVSLQAEVAQTYAQLRAAQANLAAANADIAAEQDLLALTRNKTLHGLNSDLDIKNALAQLSTTQAQAPQYEQQVTLYMNSLAVLIGTAPGTLDAELQSPTAIPGLSATAIPIGLPSSLARRRPDIRAAEASLHEQTADVGVAVAQLYPDISLTGDIGRESQTLGNLFKPFNTLYGLGPSVSLPIFDGGKLRANVRQVKAKQVEAVLTYQKTVLSALKDVENALASYRTDQQRLQLLKDAASADRASADIALDRYRHGLSDYLNVLSAQNTLIQSQQQAIQGQLAVTNDVVTLYKALGGGWWLVAGTQNGPH